MRRRLSLGIAGAALASLALVGCSGSSDPATPTVAVSGSTGGTATDAGTTTTSADTTDSAAAVLAANKASHADGSASDWDKASAVTITLSGNSAKSSGAGVTISGSTVTITAAGTYRLTGDLDGQVVVAAADAEVTLVLDGVDIASTSTAAIAITDADLAVVVLADGSVNTLSDASSYAEDADVNAALFSSADLTIAGKGSLTVTGNGNDGIASKDGLVIESGTITVTAVDDGIRGKDYLIIDGGDIDVTSGGDGLKAATLRAIVNANYIRKQLTGVFHLEYDTPTLHEAVFDDNRFDPERNAAANLVYGIGEHACPGRLLATWELRIALQALLASVQSIELAPGQPPEREVAPVGGYRRVPVILS